MQEIELFEHNEEGYKALVEKTKESNFAFLERATGTGKSYILLKYMATELKNKRVLLVTLHDSMANQFFNKDMPALGIDKNIFKKADYMLYASIPKHSADWYTDNYDTIIFDEAHHCGATKWGEIVEEIRENVKKADNKKMIGVTATATRYLDDETNVCEKYFEGELCSELGIVESMMRKLLPVPYYINVNKTSSNLINTIERKLSRIAQDDIIKELKVKATQCKNELEEEEKISSLLKKHGVKKGEKYIFFCSSIEEIEQKKKEAEVWLKDIAPIDAYQIHSYQRKQKNADQLEEFEKENPNAIKIMFTVDMFNEGLHIKNVDGLFLARKTTSPILYLQQIGRALSFSARKDQIKIFDIVGNATNIKIVYEIYKDLIASAKEKEMFGEDITHYKDIINKFRIIDAGSQQIDKLIEIETFIDENYIKKDKIEKALMSLEAYTKIINGNFMNLLVQNKVEKEQRENYKILKSNERILTFEHFLKLNEIGIIVSDYQLDLQALEKLERFGSIKNLEKEELKQVLKEYQNYCLINFKRPSEEEELSIMYRKKLEKHMKEATVKNYLKEAKFPLNVEEILILDAYFPPSNMVEEYMDKITEKYTKGIKLDRLEIVTVRKLKRKQLVNEKHRLLNNIPNNKVLKLSNSILFIESYLKRYPGQTFENINDFDYDEDLYKALKCIYRDCEHVTTHQFVKLKELKIKLPSQIDMTLEERIILLGKYDSIAEMNKAKKMTSAMKLCQFINTTHRRPNPTISAEKPFAAIYKNVFNGNNYPLIRRVTQTLHDNGIPLEYEEKLKCKTEFTPIELDEMQKEVIDFLCFNNKEKFNYRRIKDQINVLSLNSHIDIRLKRIYDKTARIIHTCISNDDPIKAKKELTTNISLIPYNAMDFIAEKFNVKINLKQNPEYISLADKIYKKEIKRFDNYYEYLKKHNSRPAQTSELEKEYIEFFIECPREDRIFYLNKLNEINIPITKYELFISSRLSSKDTLSLFNELEERINNGEQLTTIEEEIDRKIKAEIMIKGRKWVTLKDRELEKELPKLTQRSKYGLIADTNMKIRTKIIDSLKEKITQNPNVIPEYDKILITETDKKTLENYRETLQAVSQVKKLIRKMEIENKSYNDILNEKDKEKLEKFKQILNRRHNAVLVNKLEELNKQISFEKSQINVEDFIKEYLEFIKINKRVPEENPEIESEFKLAAKYKIVIENITTAEKRKFLNAIKGSAADIQKRNFYNDFVSFVETNKRFPNQMGDTDEEIELAKQYQSSSTYLTSEQKKHITELLKKYQKNTIEYVQRKRGK